jgi:hypothetical protein
MIIICSKNLLKSKWDMLWQSHEIASSFEYLSQKPLAEQTNRSVSTLPLQTVTLQVGSIFRFFCAMSNMLSHFTHAIVTKCYPLGICCSMSFGASAETCNKCA